MKNTVSEMKYTLEGISNRLDEAEDWISDVEDKVAENTQSKKQKEKKNNEEGPLGQHEVLATSTS